MNSGHVLANELRQHETPIRVTNGEAAEDCINLNWVERVLARNASTRSAPTELTMLLHPPLLIALSAAISWSLIFFPKLSPGMQIVLVTVLSSLLSVVFNAATGG